MLGWGQWKIAFERRGLDADAGMRWALGDDYGTLLISSTDDRWNERHGDLFRIKGTDRVIDGNERIAEAYENHLKRAKPE